MKNTKATKSRAKRSLGYSDDIQPGDVIALGDIHGSWDMYCQFLAWVKDSGASIILLGDMIDRGKWDLEVLNATKGILQDPESWGLQSFSALRGNHEQMFIDASEGHRSDISLWVQNGGKVKLLSKMIEDHLDWIKELPIFITIGDTMFIHAGVIPGQNPAESILQGKSEDLVWIRNPFLSKGPQLAKWSNTIKRVIHGHTITIYDGDRDGYLPIVKPDRVNIDTGAFLPEGFLTAYNVTQNTFYKFDRYLFDEEDSDYAAA